MPSEVELNTSFQTFLKEMGLPPTKVIQMNALPAERKWIILRQHRSKTEQKSKSNTSNAELNQQTSPLRSEPSQYVEALSQKQNNAKDLAKELQALEVSLRSEPLR